MKRKQNDVIKMSSSYGAPDKTELEATDKWPVREAGVRTELKRDRRRASHPVVLGRFSLFVSQ